jgi:hypothetical protein
MDFVLASFMVVGNVSRRSSEQTEQNTGILTKGYQIQKEEGWAASLQIYRGRRTDPRLIISTGYDG